MRALLDRVRAKISEQTRSLAAAPRPAAVFAPDKLAAIQSYARFCDGDGFPAAPLELFLEISNVCDLKCAMCVQFSALNANRFNQLRSAERGFLEAEDVSGHLEKALRGALLVHSFGYGEPTIHPSFREMIDRISRYEVLIDFFTNGMHLDEELCGFLVDRRVSQITISFSGATKDVYENIYLGGDFERVLAGVKRLAAAKKARGTIYPVIEVNSLGFREHVESFEAFVALMAECGVNTVHLKKLAAHADIPQLYEHVSVMRPGKEEAIVRRAVALGKRLGVNVNAELYVRAGAASEADYERQVSTLRQAAEKRFKGKGAFGDNAIEDFKTIAKGVTVAREKGQPEKGPRVLPLDADRVKARTELEVDLTAALREGETPFHCMEPYKTLYVTRNGEAKPCCFANAKGVHFGDLNESDAMDVWRGAGFATTREAVAEGAYPMSACSACLKKRSGPQGHFASGLVARYLDWQEASFAPSLRAELKRQAPAALKAIGETDPAAIMARRRARRAAAASG